MIVVTGANGQLGRGVVHWLLQRVPTDQIGVVVRDPQKARDLAARGVRVRGGDFGAPASLAAAFAETERLLIISTDVVDATRAHLHRNAVDAAKAAGVQHLLYTSVIDPDPASPLVVAVSDADTEAYIRASGVPFTILRNTLYMDLLPIMVGPALSGGAIEAAADGPVAYAVRADFAEGTANLLAQGGYLNTVLDITGGEAIDLAGAARIIGAITGRAVERRVLSDSAYREQLVTAGFPRPTVDLFLGIFDAMRQHRFAAVHGDLEKLLGRPPLTPDTFLRQVITAARSAS